MEFDTYLTTKEVARILKLTVAHVRNLCADGTINCVRLGSRTIRIPEKSLKAFLDKAEVKDEPGATDEE